MVTRYLGDLVPYLGGLAIILLATSLAFGMADPSFVGVSPDAVAFIQWTELGGALRGQYQTLYVPQHDPLAVESANMSFTGLRSGSNVSLTFSALFSSTTWTGILRGSTLTLAVPRRDGLLSTFVMKAGTVVEEYNRAALALRQRIAYLSELVGRRQAVLKADQTFRQAYQRMVSDTANLQRGTDFTSILNDYGRRWALMQKNYERLRADAAKQPLSCFELGGVQAQLGALEANMGSIWAVNGSFGVVRSTVATGIARVRRDVQTLQAALNDLQRASAGDPTKAAPQQYIEQLREIAAAAVRLSEDQVKASLAALERAEAESKDVNEKATRLLREATDLVRGLTCN